MLNLDNSDTYYVLEFHNEQGEFGRVGEYYSENEAYAVAKTRRLLDKLYGTCVMYSVIPCSKSNNNKW